MKPAYKNKIFVADEIHKIGIDKLDKNGFEVIQKYNITNNELLIFLKRSDPAEKNNKQVSVLIVRSVRKLDKRFLTSLVKQTNVRVVCTASSGFDNIDVDFCKKAGITVLNTPEGNYFSAAEHTFALILSIAKNISNANNYMKKGIFDYQKFNNLELNGKIIGIIGVGRIGSYMAKLAKAFNMNVLGNDINKSLSRKYKWISFVSLEKLLRQSDIVTLHTPLDKSTHHILNSKNLPIMKRSSVLINCSRGGTIDEKSLIKLLKSKKIHYAGIDVFENEPEFNKQFTALNNVTLTPHLAGKTKESKERISSQIAERILDIFR